MSILSSSGDIKGKKILDPPIFLLSLYLSSPWFLHFAFDLDIINFSPEYLSEILVSFFFFFFCKIIIFERVVSCVIFDVFFLLKKFLPTSRSFIEVEEILKKSIFQFHQPVKTARIIHYLSDTLNFLIHTSLFTSVSPDVVINKLWESLLVY